MKLPYTVTEQAYLDFNIYHSGNSDSMRKLARRMRLSLPIIMSLLGFGFCSFMTWRFGIRALSFAYLAGCLAIAALWYALYPLRWRKSLEKRFKAYFAEGNGKEFTGDFTLELLDDRLRTEGADAATESSYGRIGKVLENKGCLYIYTGSMTAVILPLNAFGSDEAYREFRSRLEEKVRAAKEAHEEKDGTQTGGKPQQQG